MTQAAPPRRLFAKLLIGLVTGLCPALTWAGIVRILKPDVELRFTEMLQKQLSPQGFVLRDEPLHWLNDVQVSDYGLLEQLSVGSLLRGVDAVGSAVEIHCDTVFVSEKEQWVYDVKVPNNPSCLILHTPHPAKDWKFVAVEWFPHAGMVDKKNFQILYDAFTDYLVRRGYSTPSWTRDSWILRVATDSQLQVQRLWIFASALIDRESLNVEKRADCHGEIHRVGPGVVAPGSGISEEIKWSVHPTYTCRIQLYRYSKTCFGPTEADCDYDWNPCDGQACDDSPF